MILENENQIYRFTPDTQTLRIHPSRVQVDRKTTFIAALDFFLSLAHSDIHYKSSLPSPDFVLPNSILSLSRLLEPIRMDNGSAKKDAMDRLSRLPDDVIHKILSFISIQDAIGTSVLSSRWRFIWNSMPNLNFENFNHRPHHAKFISNVLSHRNNQIQVSSVTLHLGKTVTDDESVTRILNCAFSHNVQQLTIMHAHQLVSLLQQLRSVKILKLNMGILERLSLSLERSPDKACVFANAKLSKFETNIPIYVYLEAGAQEKVTTSIELKNYKTSPIPIFPMVSCEEITAMNDMASARVFVKDLGMLLKECKANIISDTNKAFLDDHGKSLVEMHWAQELQWNLKVIMAVIHEKQIEALESCFMMGNIYQKYPPKSETHPLIAWLRDMRSVFWHIARFVNQMSASKRVVMLQIFLSMCQEAVILTNTMIGWMKTIEMIEDMNALII
ncbi:hypothetical protein L2E82_44250 [Cichorium intybus]|uniref:Uncharacterized protein n=1 Tax=Cichorium intybus TaxID=13427 RepID=A0ACB8ZQW9_CICIN|nr:hypothetical protein L2E82_44250 [Cichorium intybus]